MSEILEENVRKGTQWHWKKSSGGTEEKDVTDTVFIIGILKWSSAHLRIC